MSNMHIIEYIGKEGIRTAKDPYTRIKSPHSGDLIGWGKNAEDNTRWKGTGRFSGNFDPSHYFTIEACDNLGSAYLTQSGNVSISGGTFPLLFPWEIESTHLTQYAPYWNFADKGSGGGNGCEFQMPRPYFTIRYRFPVIHDAMAILWKFKVWGAHYAGKEDYHGEINPSYKNIYKFCEKQLLIYEPKTHDHILMAAQWNKNGHDPFPPVAIRIQCPSKEAGTKYNPYPRTYYRPHDILEGLKGITY